MSLIDGIISEELRYGSIPYTETGENHQIFSDIVNSYGLEGCQNQPWCATYQFALELQMCGKEAALRHWNMTEQTYAGYNCFSTEAAFQRAGKTGQTPRVGALVIFRQSHMGRVLSMNATHFVCGEGNTSNKEYDRNGDACAVKTYAWSDPKIRSFCYIDYEGDKLTPQTLIAAAKAVYEMAHYGKYKYGDSHAIPPCADGIISCDRLIARSLWNMGYSDQPAGGITVLNMESYLLSKGFTKITDQNQVKAGDIVLMKWNGESSPSARWHTYLVTAVTKAGSAITINKYDMGSQERIEAAQPFVAVPINQWPSTRSFYAIFRPSDESSQDYVFSPSDVKSGARGASQYLATEILKAYNIKGVKKDGKAQDLELNDVWSSGDMAAMTQWKLDRLRNGDANLTKGPYGAGEIGPNDWVSLLSSGTPFHAVNIPDRESHGPSVLLAQRILKANGFKGADGKALTLDAEFGDNTRAAITAWQKKNSRQVTGKLKYDDWKVMLRSL